MKYLKSTDVAAACGVDNKTIHVWIDKGKGPACFRTPGQHLRFDPAVVAAWMTKIGFTPPEAWIDVEAVPS